METDHAESPLSPILFDELMIEILLRLPVKSLVRFRCVSKSWKSLIYDPNFVKSHLERSPKNANLILTLDNIPLEYDESDIRALSCSKRSLFENPSSIIAEEDGCYRLKDTYWSVGSCNGLVCFRKSHFVSNTFTECWVRFWNPATRLRSKKSPCLHVNSSTYQFVPTRFGFGYDNSSDTYKVVAVLLGSHKTTVKVHNMGDNCWKKILTFPVFPLLGQIDGQFLSGTFNWLALRKSGSGYEWNAVTINQLVIFSLDLGKETYKQLLLPAGLDEVPDLEPRLAVLSDCLCFFHYYKGTHFVVWQMKEFGVEKSWTQLLNVSYQHLQIDNDPYHPLLPLCTSENGDVVVLANNGDFEAILYNRRDNRVERIEIPNNKVWMDAKDYVQSLVLPY